MTDNHFESERTLPEAAAEFTVYRCVCGGLVTIRSTHLACPTCGREYDSEVLLTATAETTEFDASQSMQSALQSGETEFQHDEFVDRRLGHFRILEPIGRGGMGAVYRALDESLERYVAIKVLRNVKVGANDSSLQQLFREARAQARVNHPNVAHIYYVGSEDEIPYLAMELVGNKTLADRLREGALPFRLVSHYGFQIAAALDAAAKFDIVHGDVKPANVLMVDELTVKLSDFGLASPLSKAAGGSLTTAGTPNYMPPEAMTGSIDHRGDMYSLGVTLFEMTFGRLPFALSKKTTDVKQFMSLQREAKVEFPEPWPKAVPESFRTILSNLLEKDPNDRYQSFQELGNALKTVEPIILPGASPLLRGLAWAADSFVVAMPLLLIAVVSDSVGFLRTFLIPPMAASALVAFSIGALQAFWGTTPGKRLFQIRIVDQHGLKPPRHVLGGRSALQFAFAWTTVADYLLEFVTFGLVSYLLTQLAMVYFVAEFAIMMFRRGRSIHDTVFRTRVVLDA